MIGKFNKYFYASLVVCLIGLILGIIISVFSSILIGVITFIIFDILSLIPFTSNYLEIKREINEEENEELSKGMELGLKSIKRKYILYLDVFVSIFLLIIFIIMFGVSDLATLLSSAYIFLIVLTGYLYFRYYFKRNDLNKYKFFHLIAILISSMSIFFMFNGKDSISDGNHGWSMESTTLLFFYNNTINSIYVFRIISLILMSVSTLSLIFTFKKNKPIFSLALMLIGVISGGLILLEFYLYKEERKQYYLRLCLIL